MTKVLDHGYLFKVGRWGSDESIIEAARMSTAKGFQGWGPLGKISVSDVVDGEVKVTVKKIEGDEKLLRYLYEHKHMSPFEMAGLIIEVQAPIFVVREWQRHRTQSYNELSGRYTEMPDLYYVPSLDRFRASKQSSKNKQASEEGFTEEDALAYRGEFQLLNGVCRTVYKEMLNAGIAREVARMVLPLNQYTRFRASANLRNWMQFLSLRLDPAAQYEIRVYAEALASLLRDEFPRSMELFDCRTQQSSIQKS